MYRKLLKWEWYSNSTTKDVFIDVLLHAYYAEGRYEGKDLKPGQCFMSVDDIAKNCGFTVRQVRTALKHLKMTNELTIEPSSKGSMFTVNNWAKYQGCDKQNDKRETNEGQTNDKRETNALSLYKEEEKEVNNGKREKKGAAEPAPPSLAEIAQYISAMGYEFSAERFYNYYEGQGWKRRGQAIVNWKAVADNWQATEHRGNPTGETKSESECRTSLDYDDLSRFGLFTD